MTFAWGLAGAGGFLNLQSVLKSAYIQQKRGEAEGSFPSAHLYVLIYVCFPVEE